MVAVASFVLLIVVMGIIDSRLRWPKPNETRYVSIAEQSKTLRRR